MAAPMVVTSVLSAEPAASTTAELLELPQTIFPEEWNLVDVRERLSVSSDVFPGVTDPEPHGALEEEAGQPFRHLGEMLELWSGEMLDWDSTASSPLRCLPRRSHHHHQRHGHHCGFFRLDKAPLDWNSVFWCERQLK
ncbi:unnamed protein product [Ectocarpus sp. 12 AP-2014]